MAFLLGFRLWLSLWALMTATLHLCTASHTSATRGATRWPYLDMLMNNDRVVANDGSNISSGNSNIISISLRFPRRNIPNGNTYQYIKIPFPYDAFSITGFRPDPTHVAQTHHFSIYLCSGTTTTTPSGDEFETVTTLEQHGIGKRPQCENQSMFTGFDNMNGATSSSTKAESFSFPTGFVKTVGRRYIYTHAMLEIHFNAPVNDDTSGFVLEGIIDPEEKQHSQISSIVLLPSYFELEPHRENASTSATATVRTSFKPLFIHFHFHSRGTGIRLNVTSPDEKTTYLATSYDRALNETNTVRFNGEVVIPADAVMRSTCVYNTMGEDRVIKAGFDSTDEMCNVFIVGAVEASCDAQFYMCNIAADGDSM